MTNAPGTQAPPRLLYVGDVPVESSYHGSALLYRLLQDYPADRLLVVEAQPFESLPERRLPDVAYRQLETRGHRWLNTRLSRWAGTWFTLSSPARSKRI